jgi:hypothetical protein
MIESIINDQKQAAQYARRMKPDEVIGCNQITSHLFATLHRTAGFSGHNPATYRSCQREVIVDCLGAEDIRARQGHAISDEGTRVLEPMP